MDAVDDGGAQIADGEEKADGTTGIEVTARLKPGTVDIKLAAGALRRGYIVYAGAGAKLNLEVTRAGTSAGLDTKMKVYGPRLADGSYPVTIAEDDDSGYAKFSKLSNVTTPMPGFYLVEVAAPAAGNARLKLGCTGTCDTTQPVAPIGLDIQWYQRAAEHRALSLQTYAAATQAMNTKSLTWHFASWGVILDIDETTLDNSPYQRERAELGVGYSPATWGAWVDRRAAAALPGVIAYTQRVHELGGKVIFVSNRLQNGECDDTAANLAAAGITYEQLLCKTTTSDKNPRFEQVATSTTIVQYIGDNILDFPALSQDLNSKPDSDFSAFGDRYFILPNPMYGSWQ